MRGTHQPMTTTRFTREKLCSIEWPKRRVKSRSSCSSSRYHHCVTLLSYMVLLPYNGNKRIADHCFSFFFHLVGELLALFTVHNVNADIYSVCTLSLLYRFAVQQKLCLFVQLILVTQIGSYFIAMHIFRVCCVWFFSSSA